MKSSIPIERGGIGLDLYHDPLNVAPGYYTKLDNVYFRGVSIVTRPGFKGLLTSAHVTSLGGSSYPVLEYANLNAASSILLTANGKLRKYNAATSVNTTTEIKTSAGASLTLDSPNTFAVRAGSRAAIVDGTGPLYVSDLTNANTDAYTGLNAPTSQPTVNMTNTVLDPFTDVPPQWIGDVQTPAAANKVINGDFAAGFPTGNAPQTAHNITTYSNDGVDGPSWGTVPSRGSITGALTDADEGYGPSANLDNDTINSDSTRHPKLFAVNFAYYQNDHNSKNGFKIIITAYASDNTTVLGTRSGTFVPQYAGQSTLQTHTFVGDFTDLGAEIYHYNFTIGGLPGANTHSGDSVYSWNIVSFPFIPLLTTQGAATGSHDVLSTLPSVPTQATFPAPIDSLYQGRVNGLHLTRNYGSLVTTWSSYNVIAIALSNYLNLLPPAGLDGLPGLAFHLDFSVNGTDWQSSSSAEVTNDGYASVDVTNVTIMASFQYVRMTFDRNFENPALVIPIFTFGPISGAGNLSISNSTVYAGPYYWYETEVDATADPSVVTNGVQTGLINVIESDPSPASAPQPATGFDAEGDVTLPAPINASSTYTFIYRAGGVFASTDPVARLVAKVPNNADVAYGADVSNPFYSWNHTTRVFHDNTPDSFLLTPGAQIGYSMDTGRGVPPVGAQCIAVWQNRLWLAQGSQLFGSWLLPAGTNNALYFNRVINPDDPNIAVKGGLYQAGGADNDTIKQLVPFGNLLFAFKSRSIYVMSGSDPTDFTFQIFAQEADIGCLAPAAAKVIGNRVWFLSINSIQQFEGNTTNSVSQMLERALNPETVNLPAISSTAYAKSSMIYQALRVYLAAPESGQTTNNVIYVYDTRGRGIDGSTAGWVTWRPPEAVTKAVALGSANDNGDFYYGSLSGQLYQVTGHGDIAAYGVTAASVPCTINTRGMGDEIGGVTLAEQKQVTRWYGIIETGENVTLTVGANPPVTSRNWTKTYGVLTGQTTMRIAVPATVYGDYIIPTLAWSTVTETKLTAIGLEMSIGRLGA